MTGKTRRNEATDEIDVERFLDVEKAVNILRNDVQILGDQMMSFMRGAGKKEEKEIPEAPDPWADEQINLEEELKIEKASNKRLEDENARLLDKTATLTRELVNMKRRVTLATSETLDAVRMLERTSKMVTSLKGQVAELQKYVGEHTQPKATVRGDAFPFLLNIFNRNKTPEQLESWKNDVMRQALDLMCDEADGENSVYPRPPEEEGKTE